MTCLSVLAGLLLSASFGAQYLKGKLFALEEQAKYTVPVRVEVTGFEASPVTRLSGIKEASQEFMAGLTYTTLEPSSEPPLQGELPLLFDEFSYQSQEDAKAIAEAHHPLGEELTVYCRAGDFRHASLERSPEQSNTGSVLNAVSGVSLSLALVLLWARSRFKRGAKLKFVVLQGCLTVPFLCLGYVAVVLAWQGIATRLSLDYWVQTEAVIHVCDYDVRTSYVGSTPSTSYTPRVSYSFQVNGSTVRGYSLSAGGSLYSRRDDIVAALAPYSVGAKVGVFYDPENPKQNALIKEKPSVVGIAISIVSAMVLFALIAFSMLLGWWFNSRSTATPVR